MYWRRRVLFVGSEQHGPGTAGDRRRADRRRRGREQELRQAGGERRAAADGPSADGRERAALGLVQAHPVEAPARGRVELEQARGALELHPRERVGEDRAADVRLRDAAVQQRRFYKFYPLQKFDTSIL